MRGAASSEMPYFAFRETRISPYRHPITALLCILLLLASTAIAAAQGISSSKSKQPKPTPCSTLISKCGCTITNHGFYQVQKALSTPGTLNAQDNSCIAVSAPSVTLWLADYTIDDVSWTAGIGIHLNSSAKNSFIAGGGSVISQWTTGIEDEASNVTITGVMTDNNTAAGILVQNANSVRIDSFGSHANGSYGVQLNGTSG